MKNRVWALGTPFTSFLSSNNAFVTLLVDSITLLVDGIISLADDIISLGDDIISLFSKTLLGDSVRCCSNTIFPRNMPKQNIMILKINHQ